jgi:predicted ATPase
LPVLEPRPDNLLITRFKRWLSGIWLFAPRPADLEPKSEQETESLAITGANLVSWYRSVVQESPSLADEMRKSLEPMIPGLASIRLDQLGRGARVMTLECQVGGKKFPLFVDELSDGQRALLVLYTVLHALGQRASLLVFDEPDNFVAEAEIQPWLSLLRDRVVDTGKGTLLVISHHPQVVDYLAADQAFLVWRGAEGHTRVREVLVDRERGLSASEWLRLEAPHAE